MQLDKQEKKSEGQHFRFCFKEFKSEEVENEAPKGIGKIPKNEVTEPDLGCGL